MFGELLPILSPAQAELGLNPLCMLQMATSPGQEGPAKKPQAWVGSPEPCSHSRAGL